mgnify:CR=1 FL=1
MIDLDMENVALLRRTIRRCTAILVLTVAITGISLQQPSEAGILILIAMGAVIYLLFEVVEINPSSTLSEHTSEEA